MKALILVLMVSLSWSCDTEAVVCAYENLGSKFLEETRTYPFSKPVMKNLLSEIFTGHALKERIMFLSSLTDEMVKGSILFPTFDYKVGSTREVTISKSEKIVYRRGTYHTHAYTLVSTFTGWKISNLSVGP